MVVVEKLPLRPCASSHVKAAGDQGVGGGVLQHGRRDDRLVGLEKGEESRQVGVVGEFHGGVDHQHVFGGDGCSGAGSESDGRRLREDLGGGGEVIWLWVRENGRECPVQVNLLQRVPFVQTTLKKLCCVYLSIDWEGIFVVMLQLPHRIMIVTSTFMFA